MTAKRVRIRMATGCLVTMALLPSVATLAKTPAGPAFDVCAAGGAYRAGGPWGALTFGELLCAPPARFAAFSATSPVALRSPNASASWLRKTFALFPADATPPVEPTDGTPSTGAPSDVPPNALKGELPGVVQNLRRADRR